MTDGGAGFLFLHEFWRVVSVPLGHRAMLCAAAPWLTLWAIR